MNRGGIEKISTRLKMDKIDARLCSQSCQMPNGGVDEIDTRLYVHNQARRHIIPCKLQSMTISFLPKAESADIRRVDVFTHGKTSHQHTPTNTSRILGQQ